MVIVLAIHIILSVLLIIVILVQQSQGGGLSGVLGGVSSNLFGGSGGTSFMVKTTAVIASLFGLTTILLVFYGTSGLPASSDRSVSSGGSRDIELQPYVNQQTQEISDTLFEDRNLQTDSLFNLLTDTLQDTINDTSLTEEILIDEVEITDSIVDEIIDSTDSEDIE